MKVKNHIRRLIYLMCLAGFVVPVEARDSRLADFMRKFEALDGAQATRAEWLGPKSPFAPYLGQSVVEALGETERELYGKAFTVGACRLVRMLGTIGFLNRYSHLAPAFERYKVQLAFEVYALPKLTQNQERCVRNRRGYDILPRHPGSPAHPNRHG